MSVKLWSKEDFPADCFPTMTSFEDKVRTVVQSHRSNIPEVNPNPDPHHIFSADLYVKVSTYHTPLNIRKHTNGIK